MKQKQDNYVDGNTLQKRQTKKQQKQFPIYQYLLNQALKQKCILILAIFSTLSTGILNIILPLKIGNIITLIPLIQNNKQSHQYKEFQQQFFVILIIILLIIIGVFLRSVFMKLVQQKITIDIRIQFYEKFIRNDMIFFELHKPGQLTSRLGDDITLAKTIIVNNLDGLFKSFFNVFGTLIMFPVISWKLSIPIFIMIPIYILIKVQFTKRSKALTKSYRDVMAEMAVYISQKFQGIQIIKAFCGQKFEIKKFKSINDKSYQIVKEEAYLKAFYSALSELLPKMAILTTIFLGVNIILYGNKNQLTLGNLTSFILYCYNLNTAIINLSQKYGNLINGAQSLQKIFQIMQYQPSIDQTQNISQNNYKFIPNIQGDILFQNVYFKYPNNKSPTLKNFNLNIKNKQHIGIIGQSGSGKSTITKIILRFYNIFSGKIFLNKLSLDFFDIHSLRSQISFVHQQSNLFSGTIEENIAYGLQIEQYTKEEVQNAAIKSGCYEFISDYKKFPQGLKTYIGSKGNQLSGGQRQRISIARALMKKPKILILDQVTSSLDLKSSNLIQKTLKKIKDQSKITIIQITHKLSTIQNCQRVIALKNGEIVKQFNQSQFKNNKKLLQQLFENDKEIDQSINNF